MADSIDLFKEVWESGDQMAATISSYWTQWYSDKQSHVERMREVSEYVYATSTRETSNSANEHQHSTHIPKITQIYDNLKANYMYALVPNKNWFVFNGEDRSSSVKEKRSMIEAFLRTKHRQRKFKDKLAELVDDWLLEGNCFAMVTFVNEKSEDSDGEQLKGYSGPEVLRIAPNDIVFNVAATDFRKSPKIIRSVKTLGELAREIDERPDMKYAEGVFNRIVDLRRYGSGTSIEDVNKYAQITLDGFGSVAQYLQSGYVEFLDFYGDIFDVESGTLYKNYQITVVDRRWIIRKEPVDTWKGFPAIFHAGWRKRKDNLWAMGPLENLVGIQYKINHLENAKADAFDQMLYADRVVTGDVEQVVDEPNGTKTYYINSERGGVNLIHPDTTVLNADFQIKGYEDRMELYAGAPREAMGVRSPGEKTKFEVATLDNARGRLFQYKTAEYESQFVEDILNSEVELSRRFLATTGKTATVEITDKTTGAQVFKDIGKEDLTANGKILAQGASHYARMAQLIQNIQNMMTILLQDKETLQHFPSTKLAKAYEELLEFEDYQLVELYGRIPEQLEAQRLLQAAQRKLQEENGVDTSTNIPPSQTGNPIPSSAAQAQPGAIAA